MSGITEQNEIIRAYQKLFKTPNGKIVMADLKRRYMEGQLVKAGETPETTIARAAAHDVVQSIITATTTELPDE